MTAKEILLEIVCTNEPLSAGALTSRVINHPKWHEKTRRGTYWTVKDALESLVDDGVLRMTEVNMTKKYYAD